MPQGENSGGPKHRNDTTLQAGAERTREISARGSSLGGKIGGPIGGASRSEAKTNAARKNGQKSEGRPLKPLSEIACTCSAGHTAADDLHSVRCLRGAAFKRRQK